MEPTLSCSGAIVASLFDLRLMRRGADALFLAKRGDIPSRPADSALQSPCTALANPLQTACPRGFSGYNLSVGIGPSPRFEEAADSDFQTGRRKSRRRAVNFVQGTVMTPSADMSTILNRILDTAADNLR